MTDHQCDYPHLYALLSATAGAEYLDIDAVIDALAADGLSPQQIGETLAAMPGTHASPAP